MKQALALAGSLRHRHCCAAMAVARAVQYFVGRTFYCCQLAGGPIFYQPEKRALFPRFLWREADLWAGAAAKFWRRESGALFVRAALPTTGDDFGLQVGGNDAGGLCIAQEVGFFAP